MNKTRKKLLTVAAAGLLLLVPELYAATTDTTPTANAEDVRTTRRTRVMFRPGEKSRVVTRVAPGRTLKVIARQGRWIKVRANGRTGWITRSSANATRKARKSVRKTRRSAFVEGRSKKRRGWSGASAPDDRIGADASDDDEEILDDDDVDSDDDFDEEEPAPRRKAKKRKAKKRKAKRARKAKKHKRVARRDDDFDDEEFDDDGDEDEADAPRMVVVSVDDAELLSKPSRRSRSVIDLEQGQELTVIKESDSGSWMLVEDEDGESGWIRSKEVNSAGFVYPKMIKRGGASIGYASLGSTFASDGVGELANYQLASAAASVSLGGEVIYNYSKQYLLAGDARYTGTRSSPGIRYVNMAGEAADIAFTRHEVDLGVRVGYNFHSNTGMVAYGRAGYHYGKTEIADVDNFEINLAMLPSEILKGITVGLHLDIPRLREKLGVRIGADALYPNGVREQTAGLEDGAVSSVTAAWAVAHLTYQWKPNLTLEGIYRYAYSKTEWTGAAPDSMRPHNATTAAHKDVGHTAMIGVGKKF